MLCQCSKRSLQADVMPCRCALGMGIILRCRVQLHGDPEPGRNSKGNLLIFLKDPCFFSRTGAVRLTVRSGNSHICQPFYYRGTP